jgi:hypothetical protein
MRAAILSAPGGNPPAGYLGSGNRAPRGTVIHARGGDPPRPR